MIQAGRDRLPPTAAADPPPLWLQTRSQQLAAQRQLQQAAGENAGLRAEVARLERQLGLLRGDELQVGAPLGASRRLAAAAPAAGGRQRAAQLPRPALPCPRL
jgi:hypothetical protein